MDAANSAFIFQLVMPLVQPDDRGVLPDQLFWELERIPRAQHLPSVARKN